MEINGKIIIYPDGREEILYEVSPGFFVDREMFYKMRAEEEEKKRRELEEIQIARRREVEEEERRKKEVQIVIEKPKEKKPRKEKEYIPPVKTVHPFFAPRKQILT